MPNPAQGDEALRNWTPYVRKKGTTKTGKKKTKPKAKPVISYKGSIKHRKPPPPKKPKAAPKPKAKTFTRAQAALPKDEATAVKRLAAGKPPQPKRPAPKPKKAKPDVRTAYAKETKRKPATKPKQEKQPAPPAISPQQSDVGASQPIVIRHVTYGRASDVGTERIVRGFCTPTQMQTMNTAQGPKGCKPPDFFADLRPVSRVIMPPLPGQMWGYDPQGDPNRASAAVQARLPKDYFQQRGYLQLIDWLNAARRILSFGTHLQPATPNLAYPNGGVIEP